jgi:hypothetical protein
MGFQTDLLTGISEYLHAENVGMWKPSGPYASADTAISIDTLPTSPDKGIGMTLYPVTDSGGTDTVMGLQLIIRGSPNNRNTVKDITDRCFDALHDLQAVTIGGIPIVRIWRQSGANLGPDGNNRQEVSENFYIQLTRTGAHRAD